MGRRVKATEEQWGHLWASRVPRPASTGKGGERHVSDHYLQPLALHPSPSGDAGSWPTPPRPVSSLLSLPHLAALSHTLAMAPWPVSLPCPCFTDTPSPWPVDTLGSSFLLSSNSHLPGLVLPQIHCLPPPEPSSSLPLPISQLLLITLPFPLLAPLPAPDPTQPGQRVSRSGSGPVALATAQSLCPRRSMR